MLLLLLHLHLLPLHPPSSVLSAWTGAGAYGLDEALVVVAVEVPLGQTAAPF